MVKLIVETQFSCDIAETDMIKEMHQWLNDSEITFELQIKPPSILSTSVYGRSIDLPGRSGSVIVTVFGHQEALMFRIKYPEFFVVNYKVTEHHRNTNVF